MGVDDYRDREGDAEERTGVGQNQEFDEDERDLREGISGKRDAEGDAEQRTGVGSDPEDVDTGTGDTGEGNPAGG
jgi:hypothetical protein